MKDTMTDYLENCPFFLGYQDEGKALIDVERFKAWMMSGEEQTRHCMSSERMKERIETAMHRQGGRTLEEVKRERDR